MKFKKLLLGLTAVSAFTLVLTSCDEADPQSPVVDGDGSDTSKRNKPADLAEATLYVVGDSTVDSFIKEDGTIQDSTYFYERCGWGGHISDYADSKLTVMNYGKSGKSAKDYVTNSASKPFYDKMTSNIKAGDFLMIGFGHNDEKYEDSTRFTDASKPISDPSSFKYNLYENYIKVAEEKGATPILCTPIVRYDSTNAYTGSKVHNCGVYGDYAQAIRELGEEKNVLVLDLTTYTKELFQTATPSEAIYYMSLSGGLSDNEPDLSTTDGTHINNYCAKVIDYYIAEQLYNNKDAALGDYILDERTAPTKEKDLVKNSLYKYFEYAAPELSSYTAPSQFTTASESGWYGTAFGDCGGDPTSESNGYVAKQTGVNTFEVGGTKNKGKIASTSEGISFVFKQVSKNENFELTADATIISAIQNYQAGFGLTIRDAAWVKAGNVTLLNNKAYLSNHASAAVLSQGTADTMTGTKINYWRSDSSSFTTSTATGPAYKADNNASFKVKRVGQQITLETTYNGITTVSNMDTDFDVLAKDNNYMYVGMFAVKGTLVSFTNVTYTYLGEYTGA